MWWARTCRRLEYAGFTQVKYDTYVDSDKAKDTVLTQSVAKDTEVAVDTQIVLELSKGPANTPVTKSHTFQLMEGMQESYEVKIVNKTTGQTVYSGTVPADQTSVTVSLTGTGKQTYEVEINGLPVADYGQIVVDFGS